VDSIIVVIVLLQMSLSNSRLITDFRKGVNRLILKLLKLTKEPSRIRSWRRLLQLALDGSSRAVGRFCNTRIRLTTRFLSPMRVREDL